MALARLVTRTPEFAQSLARSLEDAGYSVEFASPDVVSHSALLGLPLSPADLEVNLDDPSAASSYLVTADGTEISFAYDACEREFVLAPAWRSLKAAIAPVVQNIQRAAAQRSEARSREAARLKAAHIENGRREYELQTAGAEAARLESHRLEIARVEAARLEQQRVEAERLEQQRAEVERRAAPSLYDSGPAPTTLIPTATEPALVATSLYLPEPVFFAITEPETQPVEFSGADYFDGQGTRKLTERRAPELQSAMPPETSVQPQVETTPARTPWLVTAALRAAALRGNLRTEWNERRKAIANSPLREYDAAWLRAVPVAAIITMAFLLGWASSNSQRTSPAPAAAIAARNDVEAASSVPIASTPVSAPRSASAKTTPTRRVSRKSTASAHDEDGEDYDTAPDVVIRHYPAKNVRATQASAQRPSIKRISDLD
ncbi:MAG: hypothetical protein ABIP81_05710 [Terriglobales bacterium]